MRMPHVNPLPAFVLHVLLLCACFVSQAQDNSSVEFRVSDSQGALVPCRIHLRDSEGKSKFAEGLPSWKDHFVCPGKARVNVVPGEYTWEIERGPEFRRLSGIAMVTPGKVTKVEQTLVRHVELRKSGWYSADLHVHRPVSDIELLMSAEDLDFAPVIGWWNQPAPDAQPAAETEFKLANGRVYCTGAGEDEREGGALLYFGLKQPLDLTVRSREFPSPMRFVDQARRQNANVWIDIEKPFWWDVPTWIAVAKPDSIGISHNHMHRRGVLGTEAWGRPRDSNQYAGVSGNGLWTQDIYYHILNCGLRLPPSAGSASGVLPNPVGYNRVYVHLGKERLSRDNWFGALKSGRCFVTNGPLLRVTANEKWPGAELPNGVGSTVELQIELDSNDPVSQLEVIHNGQVVKRIACSSQSSQQLEASIELTEPGWFLVRAIADVEHTFRFASTAPWYVPSPDNQPQISRRSVQFFLDWIDERIERVSGNVTNESQREQVLRWHFEAREFWRARYRASQDDLTISRNESWEQSRDRLSRILLSFGDHEMVSEALSGLRTAESRRDFTEALEPLVALDVAVNPESRVKVSSRLPKLTLKAGRPQQFLIKVENTAGITAPLNLQAIDVATNPPGFASWCSIQIVDNPQTSRYFTGASSEFKVMQITPKISGLREIRIIGDAGQGTQDLGFRATTDVLLHVEPTTASDEKDG